MCFDSAIETVFSHFCALNWHGRAIITGNLCPSDFIFSREKAVVWN